MIFLILRHWKIALILISILSLLGGLFYYGHTKYRKGFDKATSICEWQKQEVINGNIKIKQQQDAVGRISVDEFLKRVREHTA